MKKSEFEMINSDSVRVGQKIWVMGNWLTVYRINHVNRHPFQLYEYWVDGFAEPLRVPAGWSIRIKREQ